MELSVLTTKRSRRQHGNFVQSHNSSSESCSAIVIGLVKRGLSEKRTFSRTTYWLCWLMYRYVCILPPSASHSDSVPKPMQIWDFLPSHGLMFLSPCSYLILWVPRLLCKFQRCCSPTIRPSIEHKFKGRIQSGHLRSLPKVSTIIGLLSELFKSAPTSRLILCFHSFTTISALSFNLVSTTPRRYSMIACLVFPLITCANTAL